MAFDKWDHRFMEMAYLVSSWTSCYTENREIGAVIVRDRRVIATGYNGAPAGIKTCKERGQCLRREQNIPSGQRAEICYAIHAEQNAIIQAARMGIAIEGATLYCTHQPCSVCTKIIINAGIARIVYDRPYPDSFSHELLNEAGILAEKYSNS